MNEVEREKTTRRDRTCELCWNRQRTAGKRNKPVGGGRADAVRGGRDGGLGCGYLVGWNPS